MTPGQALRAIREKHGLSLRQVAKEAGISSTYLCHIELDVHPVTCMSMGVVKALFAQFKALDGQEALVAAALLPVAEKHRAILISSREAIDWILEVGKRSQ